MIIFVINLIPIFSFSCFIMGLNRCDTLFYTILLILLLHLAKLSFDGNFTTSAELHVIRYTKLTDSFILWKAKYYAPAKNG